MRHRLSGRTLGRLPHQRKALLRGLADELLDHGKIVTTLARAKEVKRYVEPLVTLARRGDLHARRLVLQRLYKRETVAKLFGEIAPRFMNRPGGYTRIYRLGRRRGDNAPQALLEILPSEDKKKAKGTGKAKGEKKGKVAPKAKAEAKPVKEAKAEGKTKAATKTKPKAARDKKKSDEAK